MRKENILSEYYPDIACLWEYDKNDITPEEVSYKSSKNVWWKCNSTGLSYQRRVNNQVKAQGVSPYESGKIIVEGYNDLGSTHPHIALLWDYDKNDITPEEVRYSSKKSVYWIDKDNNCSYKREIRKQVEKNGKAPLHNNQLIKGTNDVETLYPQLLKIYSDKNPNRLSDYTVGSNKTVLWNCYHTGQEYERSIRNQIKAGLNSPYMTGNIVKSGVNDLETTHPHIAELWSDKNNISPRDVSFGSDKIVLWDSDNITYRRRISDQVRLDGKTPFVNGSSEGEKQLYDFIKYHYDKEVINNDRSIINPFEVDIYIPDLRIAVEYNGLYWHSESDNRDKNYHYNKWKKCNDNGVQLITVWEDDWLNNNQIIKNMLLHKLGVSQQEVVYARNTYMDYIDNNTAQQFCDTNHIQGFVSGSAYIALKSVKDNSLVAVSIYKKNGSQLNLERYCTDRIVVGGMGKLLKSGINYAKENDCSKIITFSDNEVSDGSLYERLGFIKDRELSPDYKYVYGNKRVHKFNFRKKRFRNDSELEYDSQLTEKELAILNHINKVWDCGKVRWILNIS